METMNTVNDTDLSKTYWKKRWKSTST